MADNVIKFPGAKTEHSTPPPTPSELPAVDSPIKWLDREVGLRKPPASADEIRRAERDLEYLKRENEEVTRIGHKLAFMFKDIFEVQRIRLVLETVQVQRDRHHSLTLEEICSIADESNRGSWVAHPATYAALTVMYCVRFNAAISMVSSLSKP